jgi:hypothetical protein
MCHFPPLDIIPHYKVFNNPFLHLTALEEYYDISVPMNTYVTKLCSITGAALYRELFVGKLPRLQYRPK